MCHSDNLTSLTLDVHSEHTCTHTVKLQLYMEISEQFQSDQNKRAHTHTHTPSQTYTHTRILVPCQSRFTAKQYEANQGTIGMALPLLMKALWKGNLIHQQQLRLGAPCHYQLSAPSLMFSSADAEPAWHTALSDKSTPSASQSLRTLIMRVFKHTNTHTHSQTHR